MNYSKHSVLLLGCLLTFSSAAASDYERLIKEINTRAADRALLAEFRKATKIAQTSALQKKSLPVKKRKRKFPCLECSYSSDVQYKLKVHMASHSTERPFACTQCPQRFKLRGTLIEHTRRHNNDRPYTCPVAKCNFPGAMYPYQLRNHMQQVHDQ